MVSIIVPIYNVEKYIEDCLKSITNQSYKDLEIILINDGSTDRSPEICETWAKQDARIKVIHKANGGLSSARNAGLEVARGKYIMFVDSDDIILKDMVATLMKPLESNNQIDLSVCGIESFMDGDISYRKSFMKIPTGIYTPTQYITLILTKKVDNAVWNKMYRTQMISNIKFIEGIINEDFPFISCILSNCHQIEYISTPLYLYRMRKGSITRGGINKKCWDYVNNAIEFKKNTAPKFQGLSEKIIDAYITSEMIGQLSILIKYNGENNFKSEYKISKSFIKTNIISILTSKQLKLKYKVKAVIALLCPSILKL